MKRCVFKEICVVQSKSTITFIFDYVLLSLITYLCVKKTIEKQEQKDKHKMIDIEKENKSLTTV